VSAHDEKIAKLLELAESTASPHEAQAAVAAAQRLMATRAVSEEQVRAARKRLRGGAGTDGVASVLTWTGGETIGWIEELNGVLALNFRCLPYRTTLLNAGRPVGMGAGVMGQEADTRLVLAAFRALHTFVTRESALVGETLRGTGNPLMDLAVFGKPVEAYREDLRHSWRVGFLVGLIQALEANTLEMVQEDQSYALALVTPPEVERAFQEQTVREEVPHLEPPVDALLFQVGYQQGRSWDLGTPSLEPPGGV
jgi:hypothetical protein